MASAPSPLPFVFLNVAMTADGKIATANRAVSSFGSAHDRHQLMALRTRADAVMAGARTVDSNPVSMGPGAKKYRQMRLRRGLSEYNIRVIVSGSGTVNPDAEIFRYRFSPIIVLTSGKASKARIQALKKVADEVKICGDSQLDFAEALRWLRQRWNVRHLLCEGGAEVNGALFNAGLVNELNVTICPLLFGGRDAPTIADGPGVSKLSDATQLELRSKRRIGDELFLVYRVISSCVSTQRAKSQSKSDKRFR